ncbi:MAG: right-handed parallel beta-helix repeat-containing protein [Chthonomonadales bacterium]
MSNLLTPVDGVSITRSATLKSGVYFLPQCLKIEADNITIDGNGALLVGSDRTGAGVQVQGRKGITLRNFRIIEFRHGIRATDCTGLRIENCQITSTAEVPANTIFLDIWMPAENAYGGAILLDRCTDSTIENNDLQHQQSGLLTYHCTNLTVRNNLCNYNSGYGIHLFATSHCLFEENSADYCSRFEPREGGLHFGHMGADATGFLIVSGSCHNTFRRNTARLSGDGFFLAGLGPDGTKAGCNDNLFEENDGSLSPNIAFEATFSCRNRFVNNYADRCNYGFWLGYSWDTEVIGNRMLHNRQAGMGVEMAHGITARENSFHANGHGILIWSRKIESLVKSFPESFTSHDWMIEENKFIRNGKAIRIASDQDHGIRNIPAEEWGGDATRPYRHTIRKNEFQDNRIALELVRADETIIEENLMHGNVEANIRQDDCRGTVIRNNPGNAGAYL